MSNAYVARPIKRSQIDLAYLLVEAADRGLTRSQWTTFCERAIDQRGASGLHDDVIVVTDATRHIKGLFVAEMIHSVLMGRVLEIPVFISVSAGDEDGVIEELLAAARGKAREAKCSDMRVWTQGGEGWMRVTGTTPARSRYRGVEFSLGDLQEA